MGRKLLYLFLLVTFSSQAQEVAKGDLFSTVIRENINKYKMETELAFEAKDVERVDFLFDSLVNNVIKSSVLDNFSVRKKSGKKIDLYKFEKPVFIITYASWCVPGVGEIPALNKLAKEYHKDIDFVVLFWDNDIYNVKKVARKYNNNINILYVDERENKHDHVVEILKHSLGFPTSYFIDGNKRIVDVRHRIAEPFNENYETSFDNNYSTFRNGISLLSYSVKQQETKVASKQP